MRIEVCARGVSLGLNPTTCEGFRIGQATGGLWAAAPHGPKGGRQEEAIGIVEPSKILIELVRSDVTTFDHGVAELREIGPDHPRYDRSTRSSGKARVRSQLSQS